MKPTESATQPDGSGAFILFVVLMAIGGVIWFFAAVKNRRVRSERRSRLIARGTMPEDQWFDTYCRDKGYSRESSIAVAKTFAQHLECEYTNLRPTDRFNHELFADFIHIMGIDEDDGLEMISYEFEELLEPEAADRFGELSTVGDVIALYESATRASSQSRLTKSR